MNTETARYVVPSAPRDIESLREELITKAYLAAVSADKKRTTKSAYNVALDHFKDHGKLLMKGNIIGPYTFMDRTLADAMCILIDGVRRIDYRAPSKTQDFTVLPRDGSDGLDFRIQNNALQRGIVFTAEPSLDGDMLRYDSKMQLFEPNGNQLKFRDLVLEPNSKAALRSLAPRIAKDWYCFVSGRQSM